MFTQILSFQKEKNISVVQFQTSNQNSFDYISGSKAIKEMMIEVKEINESGSVNDLIAINLSDNYIFFMDGDILEGAKQNRVLNTSVFLAPHSKTIVPVSCVEQGRWNTRTESFNLSTDISPSIIRAKKSKSVSKNLEENELAYADQGEVWDDVKDYKIRFKVDSVTENLSDVLEKERINSEQLINAFKINDAANGLAVFVNKNLLTVDLFNRTDIYSEYFNKILRSVAIETIKLTKMDNRLERAEANYKTLSLLDNIETIECKEYPGIGVGRERRFENEKLTGFQLDFNDVLIHLNALKIEKSLG